MSTWAGLREISPVGVLSWAKAFEQGTRLRIITNRKILGGIHFPLSDKGFSSYGGTIAPVYIAVTVQTGPGKHLIRWGRSLKGFKTGIGVARMAGIIVTVLAELGHPAVQEFVVVAAVGNMTG
jgi:hypothetical protein